eukprot:6486379-Amphidinium_carterae.1
MSRLRQGVLDRCSMYRSKGICYVRLEKEEIRARLSELSYTLCNGGNSIGHAGHLFLMVRNNHCRRELSPNFNGEYRDRANITCVSLLPRLPISCCLTNCRIRALVVGEEANA